MKKPLCLAALLLAPVCAAFAFPQEKPQDKKPTDAAAKTDDPMMEKMKEFGTPGPAHKILEPKVGKWTANMKCWKEPGGQPETSTGSSEAKWVFGGRFLEDNFTGNFAGQAFQGRGYCGYDNIQKKYISTWLDSMSTGMMHASGSFDPATKTFTFTGESSNCMTGKVEKTRVVEKIVDNDHITMQMFGPGPDGKEYMSMEIAYTRAK